MKGILCLICLGLGFSVLAQINSFPENEGFEDSFVEGSDIEFVTNWIGNTVASTNRIFQTSDFRTGANALAVQPITSFDGEILITLNLTGFEDCEINFYAKSNQNGSGNRSALVFFSTSIDGGMNYGTPIQIGDESTFPNLPGQSYNQYSYTLDAVSDNQSNVFVKLFVERNETGSGSAAEFLIDDVEIIADPLTDSDPPTIQSVTAISLTEVDVKFNESVDVTTSQNSNNYGIDGAIDVTNAVVDGIDNSIVHLTTDALTNGTTYAITINNVEDENGNIIASNSQESFQYLVFEEAEEFDVVINEFMPDPNPVVTTLPDAEYVELFNRSSKYFNLENWSLDGESLPVFTLAPGGYVIIVDDDDLGLFSGFSNVLTISSFSLNNSTVDNISLLDEIATTIHAISFVGSTGGVSTELINPNGPDYSQNNFGLSIDPDGGTPGEQNSIFDDTPDTTAPQIESINVISMTELDVTFSEVLEESSAETSANYSIDGGVSINAVALDDMDGSLVHIVVSPLVSGEVRTLSVNDVQDLSANSASDTEPFEYLETEEAVAGDVVINEFLSNPVNNSDDFIELFNNSEKFIDVEGWNIIDASDTSNNLPSFIIRPGEYLIVYDDGSTIDYAAFGNALTISSLTLNNSDDQIEIVNGSDNQIAFIAYEDEQDDGVSLELINPDDPCLSLDSYSTSIDPSGNTPGSQNSVFDDTPDTEAPTVSSFGYSTSLAINFSEKMDASSLMTGEYTVSGGLTIDDIIINGDYPTSINVVFIQGIEKGIIYQFTLSDVSDCAGNAIVETTFSFSMGRAPSFNEVFITEILFDPDPSVGLPEVEFLEIHNIAGDVISTEGMFLIDASSTVELPSINLQPKSYTILTSTAGANEFTQGAVGISNFPSLNNTGEQLILTFQESLISSIDYDPAWHEDSKSDGGYSLEMVDITNPCTASGANWNSSINLNGGTPGAVNSINNEGSVPDNLGPELQKVTAISSDMIRLDFSEKIDPLNVETINLEFEPEVEIERLYQDFQNPISVFVVLTQDLEENIAYQLNAFNVADCNGNLSEADEITFALPIEAQANQILISEVLFNPRTNGVDFVELYNNSDDFITLKNWQLARLDLEGLDDQVILSDEELVLNPRDFIVLTEYANVLLNNYPKGIFSKFFETSTFPTYAQDTGNVIILNAMGEIHERVFYDADYHYDLLESVKGISLERVSYDESANNSSNWRSASSTEGFATPGYANSQSFENDTPVGRVTASPEVFIPGNVGSGRDFTTINYQFDEPGQFANVNIYDQNGRLVKNLAQGASLATSGFFRWDGDTDGGSMARVGYYIIIFEIYDASGNSETIKETVAVGRDF
ncbi:MAG: lamin tail domain-containing protein [Ekhidna sp.]